MASAREQMRLVEAELDRVRREIAKLRVEEALLEKMARKMRGEPDAAPEAASTRTRSPSVKPLVLDIMRSVGDRGATTVEVDEQVRERIPTVAKDTVGSVLSRLKGDGVLVYAGERYYEKQFAPRDTDNFLGLRAVK